MQFANRENDLIQYDSVQYSQLVQLYPRSLRQYIHGGPEKNIQSSLHQNFTPVSHTQSVTRFSPKCSEIYK